MNNASIKPIQTVYKNYKFRSRLEARWAVFFDCAKIKYEYEPEGFELGTLGRYLPDFYLPEFNTWVEVKSKELSCSEREKAFALSSMTQKSVLCLTAIQDPEVGLYSKRLLGYETYIGIDYLPKFDPVLTDWIIEFYVENASAIGTDRSRLLKDALKWDVDYYKNKYNKTHPSRFENGVIETYESLYCNNMNEALMMARQARFEHGETPL